jgi:hypothetical protein
LFIYTEKPYPTNQNPEHFSSDVGFIFSGDFKFYSFSHPTNITTISILQELPIKKNCPFYRAGLLI